MKRIMLLLLVLLSIGFTACAQQSAPTKSTSPKTSVAPTTTQSASPTTSVAPAKKEAITWKFPHQYTSLEAAGVAYQKFADLIEQSTATTSQPVKVKVFPAESLVPKVKQEEALQTGTVDMAGYSGYYIAARPGFEWGGLHLAEGLWFSAEQLNEFYSSPVWENLVQTAYADKMGFKFLGWPQASVGKGYISNTRAMHDRKDQKGMKYSVAAGTKPSGGMIYGQMQIVAMNPTDANSAFQTGMLDLLAARPSQVVAQKAWEFAKYYYVEPGQGAIEGFYVTKKMWDSLPADTQKAVGSAMAQFKTYFMKTVTENENKGYVTAYQKYSTLPNHDMYVATPQQLATMWDTIKTYDVTKAMLASLPPGAYDLAIQLGDKWRKTYQDQGIKGPWQPEFYK